MFTVSIKPEELQFRRKVGPTVGGKKPLLYLSNQEKELILKDIRQDWRVLIDLHFDAEGGVTQGEKNGGIRKWKALSERYVRWKENHDLLPGILEASNPDLKTRYKEGIKYNAPTFNIWITFPRLMTGSINRSNPYNSDGDPINAGVHQLGQPQRRLIKKSFIDSAKNQLMRYLNK